MSRNRTTTAAAAALAGSIMGLWLGGSWAAEAAKTETKPSGEAEAKAKAMPIRVLILVGGHGYDEKNFEKAWGGQADIQCEIWKGQPYAAFDDISSFKHDVIVMYNLTSGMAEPQKANFLKLLGKGVGLVVWHHALANCQDWPEFEKIAGGKFWLKDGERDGKKIGRSGTGFGDIKMHIADPNHPITKGMADFVIYDEPYNKQTFVEGIHVLISSEDPKSDKAVAWAWKYSAARVFSCQLGHDVRAWTNPALQRLLANGIRWVAGRLVAQATPPSR